MSTVLTFRYIYPEWYYCTRGKLGDGYFHPFLFRPKAELHKLGNAVEITSVESKQFAGPFLRIEAFL